MTPLLRYTLLGTSASPATAHCIARVVQTVFPDARTAVDLSPGHGCFWSESVPTHLSVTLSPYDFTALPYGDASFDLPFLDPPHVADAGVRSIIGTRFGSYRTLAALEAAVRQGAREAWRVSRLGVVIKVTDAMHCSRFVRMSGWVYAELGEPYDVVHQVRLRALIDPRWREPQLSARNNGSTYLIFRHDGPVHRRRPHGDRTLGGGGNRV
jgi:hypothetical protein